MASPDVPLLVCKYCLSEQVRECLKCKSRYCVLHAAKFSPNFCKECLPNLSAITNTIMSTSTEYDMLDNELILKTVKHESLRLDGASWIFYSTWIENLNEEDWLEIYQFHYFILKMMEYENEVRKVKKARRAASAPLSVSMTKQSTTKKVVQAVDMQAKLEKLGIPTATIKAMLQAAGITYKEPVSNNGNN